MPYLSNSILYKHNNYKCLENHTLFRVISSKLPLGGAMYLHMTFPFHALFYWYQSECP